MERVLGDSVGAPRQRGTTVCSSDSFHKLEESDMEEMDEMDEIDEFEAEMENFDAGAPAQNPPCTKQGGRKTSDLSKSEDGRGFWCGVDYLTTSFPRHFHPGKICQELNTLFQATVGEIAGEHGYAGRAVCGGYGKVMQRECRDSADADVLVRLPGRALDWIRDNNVLSETDLQCTDADICRLFVDRGFRSTRLDIAMDSNDPAITPEVVEDLINRQSFVCRAKMAGLNDRWNTERPKSKGTQETMYMGSRISSRFFRCYNKRAEHFKRTGKDVGHLTRFELEMKGEAATKAMSLIAQKGHYCIPNLFAGWIDFKEPNDTATRTERRGRVDWWERLIAGAEPIHLGLMRGVSQPEQSLRWVKEQVSKTLFLAHRHGFFEEIIHAINSKKYKIKDAENERWKYYAHVSQGKKRKACGG